MSEKLKVNVGVTFTIRPAVQSTIFGDSFKSRVDEICRTTLKVQSGVMDVFTDLKNPRQLFLAVAVEPGKVSADTVIRAVLEAVSLAADHGKDSDLLTEFLRRYPGVKGTPAETELVKTFERLVEVARSGDERVLERQTKDTRQILREQSLRGLAPGQDSSPTRKAPRASMSPVPPQYGRGPDNAPASE